MANNQLILVYQDCPMCGSRENWGKKQLAAAKANRADIRKVSFVSAEGRKYCYEAIQAKKATMPFFTDGEGHFAPDVESLMAEIKPKSVNKPRKSHKKKVEDKENGDV